ncbi:TPR repeat-containing protein [Thermobaculum terrenum ATCC BAA-798]|uniref:TPR repeat-containing protein n=2 Tax=Thermobaculum TaxID=262406 RepID=D1CDZ2_THET1|nr:TPR repeat-containing protein [Thermobaculum terrenum ATCC BAA-798]
MPLENNMSDNYFDNTDSGEVTIFDLRDGESRAKRLIRAGRRHTDEGRFEEAARAFEQAVEISPKKAEYRVELAAAYRNLIESGVVSEPEMVEALLERAYSHLMEAVRLDPEYAPSYRLLGYVYEAMDAPWRAKEMWNFYLEMDPNGPYSSEVRSALEELDRVQNLHYMFEEASYLVNHGDPERALEILSEILEEEPDWYEAWFWRGLACREMEMISDAIESFARAVELDPESTYAYHELASLLARKGEVEAAEGFWHKALDLDPEEPWIMTSLALLLWRDERRDEAEKLFLRVLDIDPANRKVRNYLRNLRAGMPPPHLVET